MKKCFKCIETKNLDRFYKHLGMKDGHLNKCIDCTKLDSKDHYIKSGKEYQKLIRANWRIKNKEKNKLMKKQSRKRHPATGVAQLAKRRATLKNAMPKWLTIEQKQEIKQFYIDAKELQWLSDPTDPLEVDHIVPLQGEIVSGLHVPWNLQILPKSTNVKKSNKVF